MSPPTPQSDNYRVVLKLDEGEFEIGSIGVQHGCAWRWGIDTVIPMRAATRHHLTQTRISGIMARFREFQRRYSEFLRCLSV
jgi:hypothetical protein